MDCEDPSPTLLQARCRAVLPSLSVRLRLALELVNSTSKGHNNINKYQLILQENRLKLISLQPHSKEVGLMAPNAPKAPNGSDNLI